ncbi:hypothetical protein GE09DRAFT_1211067 [Coniochaeta sp. 2T2.1]|nr:hypothetical protein GE09DRAFT_1211067 [Coniochaeta sp. 2T2.1]
MDGISAASAIAGLCFTSGQLLVGFFEYIKDVRDVPQEVSSLTMELCALNTALLGLKALFTSREGGGGAPAQQQKKGVLLAALTRDSAIALDNCRETMQQIEEMVKKSKVQMEEVALLRDKVEGWRSTISLMLQVASEHGQDEAAALLEKIHQSVTKLESDRQHVKETLVVMDKDHRQYDDPEFSATIKPVARPPGPSNGGTVPPSSPFRPFNKTLVDVIQSESWTGVTVQCKSAPWEDVPCLSDASIKLIISSSRRAYTKLTLSPNSRSALASRHARSAKRAFSIHDDNAPANHFIEWVMPMVSNLTITRTNRRSEARASDHFQTISASPIRSAAGSSGHFETTPASPLRSSVLPDDIQSVLPSGTFASDIFPPFLVRGVDKGFAFLDFIFCPVQKTGRSVVVNTADGGEVELAFVKVEDADRFFALLEEVQAELESSWGLYVRSFANIDAALAVGEVDGDMRAIASREYALGNSDDLYSVSWTD